ncbi:hypothetical protein WJX73_008051 [Symbiochloris irregularis]|uniref:Photolyase/cryptochrome alpha/beta domain-containing protein n=1 Tax=Symbiochloris irregularis TaxID=706552 RepID=A0AAW1NPV9_9CHLO
MTKKGRSLLWFRKGLRLHDNPALLEAAKDVEHLFPVFCIDPHFYEKQPIGVNRINFLFESLADLHESLSARGSRLLVLRGDPKQILPQVWKDWGVTKLCYEQDTEPYALERDNEIGELAKKAKVEVKTFLSHTLYDPVEVKKAHGGKTPETYKAFQSAVAKMPPPPSPVRDAPEKLPTIAPKAKGAEEKATGVPTLAEVGYTDKPTTSFHGGETKALARLTKSLEDKEWVVQFEKPKTSPAALEPSTTVLSPYMKFGCISARLFYAKLVQIEKEKKKHTSPPTSLVGQLLWRDFFYTVGYHTPNFHHMLGNPLCKQIQWDVDPVLYKAWDEGRTGYPWIDAIMVQLQQQGWMHHLARHSVACFLTRGDLYVSWTLGRDTFDRLLIDGDHFVNNGNWMWLSASAFFSQFFRVYSPITFGKKYDKQGKFIKHFLPVLKDMPDKYIYEPWTAPEEVQKKAKCIIGKDYPKPVVEHATKHKDNLNRMKSAYDANKSPQKRKEISDGFDEMARAEVLDMEADDDEDEEK